MTGPRPNDYSNSSWHSLVTLPPTYFLTVYGANVVEFRASTLTINYTIN